MAGSVGRMASGLGRYGVFRLAVVRLRMRGILLIAVVLTGCSRGLTVPEVGQGGPDFDPVRFFSGHVRSWGVMEDRGGQPTGIVTTDCEGVADGPDGLLMTQRLVVDGRPSVRVWRMRRVGAGRFEATANDMVGIATGEASGRAFQWHWTLALSPGNWLENVDMEQWWYLQDDGSMLNRTIIRKVGVVVAEVTEHFVPVR
ncbi:MAG: DUF3833 family protein [Rhodospirillales bacterium]|nr:DUF3833 family protein [Rhodospirillales bacterium]